jgi:hypothetical protein
MVSKSWHSQKSKSQACDEMQDWIDEIPKFGNRKQELTLCESFHQSGIGCILSSPGGFSIHEISFDEID